MINSYFKICFYFILKTTQSLIVDVESLSMRLPVGFLLCMAADYEPPA